MKQTTKNKIKITALAVAAVLFALIPLAMEVELKSRILMLAGLLVLVASNVSATIRNNKDFTIIDGMLVVRRSFAKEQRYDLGTVSCWTEDHYQLFDFTTSRSITLKTTGGNRIFLVKRNPEDFEKLSGYLNAKLPEAFKKKC